MRKIFIAGLIASVDDQELAAAFEMHGLSVKFSKVIRDRETRESRGFGFVEFETDEGYGTALLMNGFYWHDQKMRICPARERSAAA